ncbi:MAG: DUF2809 domain-containing protein [Urechidicola sp.]|nr:DUF2809 domain-containing protein [Urechidicola sp.]
MQSIKLNKFHLTTFIFLLLTELIIFNYYNNEFIRFVLGDFLVVILLYSFNKSFIKINPRYIAILVLIIAYMIEFLQLINILKILNVKPNTLTRMVLGSTFSVEDMIAYSLGVAVIYCIDKLTNFS